METENFKEQQQDRIEEGKELKREDELTDVSRMKPSELPGKKSLFSKLGETISSAATTIADKISGIPVVEGHEDLDRDVRKQVKKINKEIQGRGVEENPAPAEWEKSLPKQVREGVEGAKDEAEGLVKKISEKVDDVKDSGDLSSKTTIQPNREGPSPLDKINQEYANATSKVEEKVDEVLPSAPKESTSILGKIQHGISTAGDSISHKVGDIKQRFVSNKEEERNDDGTKNFRDVDNGFTETVDELKHEKRIEELGQEELSSKNPFKVLDTGSDANNQEEGETRTLGEKIKGGLNDAGSKLSGKATEINQKVKGVFERAPQDKENAQQIA